MLRESRYFMNICIWHIRVEYDRLSQVWDPSWSTSTVRSCPLLREILSGHLTSESSQVALVPSRQSRILESPEIHHFSWGDIPSSMLPGEDTNSCTEFGFCSELAAWLSSEEKKAQRPSWLILRNIPQEQLMHVRSRVGVFPEQTRPNSRCSGFRHCVVQEPSDLQSLVFWGMAGSFAPAGPAAVISGDCNAMQRQPFDSVHTLSFPRNLCSWENRCS